MTDTDHERRMRILELAMEMVDDCHYLPWNEWDAVVEQAIRQVEAEQGEDDA